ncbi:MAG TPA: YHS domain-containing protein [Blastocatellia bacterium]|nr:YHS domain-containing protein [Blastocatellia bacterium]
MKKVGTVFLMSLVMICSAIAVVSKATSKLSLVPDGNTKLAVTNKRCPVSGDEVNTKLRVEYQGQYVYFCCDGCPQQFQAEPAKYLPKLSAEDREAIKANEKCPISGGAVDKDIWVESEGRKVYFCCPDCAAAFKKDHPVTTASKAASGD